MRPLCEAWLAAHGLPPWVAPSYATMVGIASVAASMIVLRRTEREGDDVRGAATTLLVAYVAALLGGYVYELLRVTPDAIAEGSLHPYLHVGRAAYGGLLFATLAAAIHVRRRGASVGAFFDRVSVTLGIVYAAVRTGCFLEGCDYGAATAGPLGVVYPPTSLAALDHVRAGWIEAGAASLPTHPTQLYEGAVALVGSAVALAVDRRKRAGAAPAGSAFLAWLVVYAVGRAAVETVRGDVERGLYGGVSSAQWTSLVLGIGATAALALAWHRARGEAPAAPTSEVIGGARAS